MAFTARIRGIEVVCETISELDALLAHYGDRSEVEPRPAIAPPALPPHPAAPDYRSEEYRRDLAMQRVADEELLRTFIAAGDAGVPTSRIRSLLGDAAGRGIPSALHRWAVRVRLTTSGGSTACLPARPQGDRGWRLSPESLHVTQRARRNAVYGERLALTGSEAPPPPPPPETETPRRRTAT